MIQRIGRADDGELRCGQLLSITDSDAPHALKLTPDYCAPRSDHLAMVAMDPESIQRGGTYDDINLNRPLLTPVMQGRARSLKLRL